MLKPCDTHTLNTHNMQTQTHARAHAQAHTHTPQLLRGFINILRHCGDAHDVDIVSAIVLHLGIVQRQQYSEPRNAPGADR